MRNEAYINKILDVIQWGLTEASTTDDRRKKEEILQGNKVLQSIVHKLGYRTRKANTDRPTTNPFQEGVKKMQNKPIVEPPVIDNTVELNRMFVATEEAKAALKKQREKYTRTSDKQKNEVVQLYKAKNTVFEISEKLHIAEESINKILGIENNDNKVLLADSSDND